MVRANSTVPKLQGLYLQRETVGNGCWTKNGASQKTIHMVDGTKFSNSYQSTMVINLRLVNFFETTAAVDL
jgi:hypothetical protein